MLTLIPNTPAPHRGFTYEREAREKSNHSELVYHSQLPEPSSLHHNLPGLLGDFHQDLGKHIVTREWDNRWEALPHLWVDSPGAWWLANAIGELAEIDDEVAEEALPELAADTKKHARRIIFTLTKQPIAPTVYPTTDGEIALYFKSPVAASSVLILVGNNGRAACFSYINGKNRRARYDDASDLPDEFVKAQIRALKEPTFL